jgi:hypothetical protein
MKSNRNASEPGPELGPQMRRAEEELQQLQPRPLSFDAEMVIAAANSHLANATASIATADVATTDVTTTDVPAGRQNTHWLTIATASVCGAVVGALLTAATMATIRPASSSIVSRPSDQVSVPDDARLESREIDSAEDGAPQVGGENTGGENTGGENTGGDRLVNNWAPQERLISAQLRELYRPSPFSRPLTPGNFRRNTLATGGGWRINEVGFSLAPEGIVAPLQPKSLDSDNLLRELLGSPL